MFKMFKKKILILTLLILSNCSTPGTALLGPVFTGAKTGSIYQASLSYGTGKVMNKLNSQEFLFRENIKKDSTFDISYASISEVENYNDLPEILISYKIDKIEFSELIEPEPLP